MAFSDPIYLLLALPAFAWMAYVARRLHGMQRTRKVVALSLRTLILALLILALAGLQTVRSNRGVSTVFLIDRSASMSTDAGRGSEGYVRKALEARGPDDNAGLIAFGKDPDIDTTTGALTSLGRIYASPDPSATDIAAAIRLASATFPPGSAKRIVLLSDGNETQGDAAQAAAVAATEGVQIDWAPIAPRPSQGGEVVMRDLVTPASVTHGQPFELRAIVDADKPTDAVIHLDRDGVPLNDTPVRLAAGANSVVLSQNAGPPGFYRYRAVVEAAGDIDPRNNAGMAYVGVRGAPTVLLLEGKPGSGAGLEQALTAHNIAVVRGGREKLPVTAADMQPYDSILLSDFSADDITDRQMTLMAAAANQTGIGLGMIGGDDSYLPGGYYGTPIADALPVDLNVRQRRTYPSTTVVLVLDTSGSMGMIEDGVEKVKIAASAAAATVTMMNPNDYIGVAGSTDDIAFVAPIQHPVDKTAITEEIGKMDVGGGGIYVRPSLEFAENALYPVKTRVRHLILMADGNDCDEQEGALQVAQRMVAQGMTVSVVAIGDGKDVGFLKALAAVGKGQFYLALQAKDLQRMFTRDASTMTRSAIEEGAFLPKVDPDDEALHGLDLHAVPPLYAYDLTSDRPLSRVPMRTNKDDPLLAFWQYGLSTTMAFTSDAQPKWAAQWMGWNEFSAFWSQVVRSTMRRASANNLQITTTRQGDRGVVDIQAADQTGLPINGMDARVTVVGPDGRSEPVAMDQVGAGKYQADFTASQPGGYMVTVAEHGPAGRPAITRSGFAIAYPPEYQTSRPNTPLLSGIAQATGGRMLDNPVLAFRPSTRPGRSIHDLWQWLLLVAALLLPVDIAVRRLAIPFGEIWERIAARMRVRRPRRASLQPAPQAAAISRLSRAKDTVSHVRSATGDDAAETVAVSQPSPVAEARPTVPEPKSAPLSTAQRLLEAKRKRQG